MLKQTLGVGVLLFGLTLPVMAQDAPPASYDFENVTLAETTENSFGITAQIPSDWVSAGNGIYLPEGTMGEFFVALQAAPVSMDDLLLSLSMQYLTDEPPTPIETATLGNFEWDIYRYSAENPLGEVWIQLAVTEAGNNAMLAMVQGMGEGEEASYENVFLPMVESVRVASSDVEVTREPVPYLEEEVTFQSGDITLAGTLTLPETEGPYIAVVLVSGSGPQDRNESITGVALQPFYLIADHLTRNGIAVLRYDDRGVAESEGDFSAAVMSDFASDASAAIDYLATRSEIDPARIGLLGHSEGGALSPMVARQNEHLAFIVSMAGTAVSGADVLILQNELVMAASGGTPELVESQRNFITAFIPLILNDDYDGARQLTVDTLLEQYEMMDIQVANVQLLAEQTAEQSMATYMNDWFRSFLSYNPADDFTHVTIPVLGLFGGKDVQVADEQNAPALEAVLTEAGNENFEIVIFENANHFFQEAETGSVEEYATLPAEFTEGFLDTISDWILENFGEGA